MKRKLSPAMQAALVRLWWEGKQGLARNVPLRTISALHRRGLIDSALNIIINGKNKC